MNITESIPNFGFSTQLNNAHEVFGQVLGIIAYVEACEDVRFWTIEFKKLDLEVNVKEISATGTANGKDAILTAIKKGRISLGKKLIVCLDSDYDYLLSKNTTIYNDVCCFQTYAYAIENYYYNPAGLTELCCVAACTYQNVNKNHLEYLLVEWSKYIYGCFLQYIDKIESKSPSELDAIKTSIEELTLTPKTYQSITTHTLSNEKITNFSNKGLRPDNVFLYFRGHDLESKIKKLATDFVNQLSKQKKEEIKAVQPEHFNEHCQEYFNNRLEIKVLLKTRPDFPNNHCYTLLQTDIQKYKEHYTER